MALVTITGTLATDSTPAKTCTSSFILDVVDFTDTTQPIGNTYELVSGIADAGSEKAWTLVENTTSQEAIVRANIDGTNYAFLALPALGCTIIPPGFFSALAADTFPVFQVHARSLASTSILRVITLFVA